MRYYPIHVTIKDFSFMFLYMVLSGSFSQVGLDGLLLISSFALRMISGMMVMNLILQTTIYFGLKHYIRWRKTPHKFMFGLALHIPTLVFCVAGMRNDGNLFSLLMAIVVSSLISGALYVFLNGGFMNFRVKNLLQGK